MKPSTRIPRFFSFTALLALAGVVLTSLGVQAAHPYGRGQLDDAAKEFQAPVKQGNKATIANSLLNVSDPAELDLQVVGLVKSIEKSKQWDLSVEIVDELLAKRDAAADILAADFILKMADVAIGSGWKATIPEEIPDALWDRAARMLEHPDPVVQAMAEWALTLRVKRVNAKRGIDDLFQPSDSSRAWYEKWQARPRELDLRDDYGRQLAMLNRHRDLPSLVTEIEKVAARMEAIAAASKGRTAEAEAEAEVGNYFATLKTARELAEGKDLVKAHGAYLALRATAREVIKKLREEWPHEGIAFYTSWEITGGDWNVNVPVLPSTNKPGGDIYLKTTTDPAAAAEPQLQGRLGDGSNGGIDLIWEADRILFSFWPKQIDPKAPGGYDRSKNAGIYEIHLPTGEIVQRTDAPGHNDIEPCYLPDDGFIFSSDRSAYGNQCAGPFMQDKRCTTLFRYDPKRYPEPVAISNNKDFDRFPRVLNDGTIAFMHWEYQERGLYHTHAAWVCRPDGTNMDAFYKQHISQPMSIREVRQAPNSSWCVATAQGHHDAAEGPVILFDPAQGINNEDVLFNVTPGASPFEGGAGVLDKQIVEEGGVENRGGTFASPFPMSTKAFLVAHEYTANQAEYGLYYIDVWGNRELLHKDQDMSCMMPFPLRQRVRPPVIADQVKPDSDHAVAFLQDVYRDLPGVEPGSVKYLRISQALPLPAPGYGEGLGKNYNHLHWLPGDSTAWHFGYWTWSPRRTVGIVKVEPDGSAYFKVPAGTPVYLQALDENFMEVRRMRTSFTLQRGEFRSCVGCHETRTHTPVTAYEYPKGTLEKGPQMPEPPSWGDTYVLDYKADIQPIFDAHCVECHGQKDPAGGIELTSREIGGFMQSYRSIFGLKPGDPTPVKELDIHLALNPEAEGDDYITQRDSKDIIRDRMMKNEQPGQLVSISNRFDDASITQPLQFGSNKSKLTRVLIDDPAHAALREKKMSAEEWMKLVTWVDHNAIYESKPIDKSHFDYNKKTGKLVRVPFLLPSPWIPGDVNPTFFNPAEYSDGLYANKEVEVILSGEDEKAEQN